MGWGGWGVGGGGSLLDFIEKFKSHHGETSCRHAHPKTSTPEVAL